MPAGALMVLLCLCGGGGVVTAIPVAIWLVYLTLALGQAKAPLPTEARIMNPIDAAAKPEEKVLQLQLLTAENRPLIDAFLRDLDCRYGTHSGSDEDGGKLVGQGQSSLHTAQALA